MDQSTAAKLADDFSHLREILTRTQETARISLKWQADAEIRQLLKEPRYGYHARLEHAAFRTFSENGEDGMIQEIFKRIGTTNRKFVEFGVTSGIQCNTHLLLHIGWSGLWIEADEKWATLVEGNFAPLIREGRLTLLKEFVTPTNINELLSSSSFDGEIDLLSVDVDGDDYYILGALTAATPRVIVVEYNASFSPPIEYVNEQSRPDGLCFGASLSSMATLLSRKGYSLVGTDICGVNAFFVRHDQLRNQFVQVDDISALYNPPRYGLSIGFPTGHPAPQGWNPSSRNTP